MLGPFSAGIRFPGMQLSVHTFPNHIHVNVTALSDSSFGHEVLNAAEFPHAIKPKFSLLTFFFFLLSLLFSVLLLDVPEIRDCVNQ